jgi:serine phosphatase RsbU (regulator of sigma subunit)/CHASE3 domain sensor protein
VPLLVVASFFVQNRVDETLGHERQMRVAQIARGVVLRTQIDEETGVRGYAMTGEREFLLPFVNARARAAARFDHLIEMLASVHLGAGARRLVETERELNAEWLHGSAEPLIADPRRTPRALALDHRGKSLIDSFRKLDQRLQTILDSAAEEANRSSSRAIAGILILNAVALTLLTLAALVFGYLQARSARAAFEARVLYENEKRIADALQEAFLQKALPLTPGVGLHATYVPASREAQVGGDWYDALELPSGRILFSIGDVAGHGLDAAVVMSRARQSIVSTGLGEDDPARVLARANRSLVLQNSRMVTAICGYLDPATREVAYATAGHPPPVMATADGSCDYLPHEGLPLGIIAEADYTTFRVRAEPGAMLVLYTDGVLEHKRDVIAGQARLLEAVRGAVGASDPALEIQRAVFEKSEPTDDVAILAISFGALDGDGATASVNALQLNRWHPQTEPVASDSPNDEAIRIDATASGL